MRRISVRGIVINEDKLLCVRLKAYKNHIPRDNSYWCLPGGGLEDGEPLNDGIDREMIEETGIKPVIGDLIYVQQFKTDEKEFLEFFFDIKNSLDYLNVDLSKTTHGQMEIEEISFIDPSTNHILPEFLKTITKDRFSNNGTAVRIISRL